ncbi:carbohydrate ABC transporter permease [Microlunatus sp. GCM10028923]|uniref:carbohydrate ABC transporter permease n=1 Tax=Microlunatus sp. GCM10028923 TaxID=3273400 RepID=UPI0036072EF4
MTYAVTTIVLTLVIAAPAALVIARHTNLSTHVMTGWIRIAQVVGGIVVIIPVYVTLRSIGLTDTLLGVSPAELIPSSAVGIWLLIGFVRQIPVEFEEAARIDGASEWQVLRHITMPLIRPGLVSVILVVFMASWNDFLNPLILLSTPDRYTVMIALFSFLGQIGQVSSGGLLAYATLSCLIPFAVKGTLLLETGDQGS